jgi:hypothetical protein
VKLIQVHCVVFITLIVVQLSLLHIVYTLQI